MPDVTDSLPDLDAILAAGWARPADLTAEEFIRAENFWESLRRNDQQLQAVRAKASELIRAWTGLTAQEIGSLGIQTNLTTSDLDLGIGYAATDRRQLIAALTPNTTFKGEQTTRFNATRLAFQFMCDGIKIDVTALTQENLATAHQMLECIHRGMSRDDRIAYTWVKHLLHKASRLKEYETWKTAPYIRFCAEYRPGQLGSRKSRRSL